MMCTNYEVPHVLLAPSEIPMFSSMLGEESEVN
jgi:hypothetical protein